MGLYLCDKMPAMKESEEDGLPCCDRVGHWLVVSTKGHSFKWNEDRATVFLKWTAFSDKMTSFPECYVYVMANIESGLELSQLNSSPKLSIWGLKLSQVKNSSFALE